MARNLDPEKGIFNPTYKDNVDVVPINFYRTSVGRGLDKTPTDRLHTAK